MLRASLVASLLTVALSCGGCFVVPDPPYYNVRVRGSLRSAAGVPLQERIAVVYGGKRGLSNRCGPLFTGESRCVEAILTPDADGKFDFGARRADGCLLWLLPPLGTLPCDHRAYLALVLENSPKVPTFLTFDFRRRAVAMRSAPGQAQAESSAQVRLNGPCAETPDGAEGLVADLTIVRP